MELKNEALSHSLALIESSTHPILIQLLDADHLWSLLQQTVNLIGRPEGTLKLISQNWLVLVQVGPRTGSNRLVLDQSVLVHGSLIIIS